MEIAEILKEFFKIGSKFKIKSDIFDVIDIFEFY